MWGVIIFLVVWLLAYVISEVCVFLAEVCHGEEE